MAILATGSGRRKAGDFTEVFDSDVDSQVPPPAPTPAPASETRNVPVTDGLGGSFVFDDEGNRVPKSE